MGRAKKVGRTVRPTQDETPPKVPRKGPRGKKATASYAEFGAAVDAKVRPRLGGIPVNYCYTFNTSWTGDLSRYSKKEIKKWERERLLYNIVLMDHKRFQLHTQKSNTLRIRNTIKGETISFTVLQQVYLEFTDLQRTVPVEELIHYTDPLTLLDEMGVK